MEKKRLLGVVGGLILFLALLFIILYPNDFDQELIEAVDSGVSANKLIPDIEKEAAKDRVEVKKHMESHLMDPKLWQRKDISLEDDLHNEISLYEEQLNTINKYEAARKKFVKKEISKEQFLQEIRDYKIILNRDD